MTGWIELRHALLVGTERRPLAIDAIGDRALTADASAEVRALEAVALLGAQRRAGAVAQSFERSRPMIAESSEADLNVAPAGAVQILELLLAGNLGRPATVLPLLELWFERCAGAGAVLPHRLLVPVLDRSTATEDLRGSVRPILGSRGRWLAEQREDWSWVSGEASAAVDVLTDVEAFLALGSHDRADVVAQLRSRDPATGRALLVEALPGLDAASRAKVVSALTEGLGPEDEELLEGLLDDRSKVVRATALRLLDGLPSSHRAVRMAARLEPLVARSGRLRRTLTVSYPRPPEGDQLRDLPPSSGSQTTVEAEWLQALIAGTPLSWWEQMLDSTPAQIVGGRFEPADDLLVGWTRAAVAQRDTEWAAALLGRRATPELVALAGPFVPPDVLVGRLSEGANVGLRGEILAAIPQPWPTEVGDAVLRWASRLDKPAVVVSNHEDLLAACLPTEARPRIEAWLARVNPDDDRRLHTSLRHLIQHIATRTSIVEAFS